MYDSMYLNLTNLRHTICSWKKNKIEFHLGVLLVHPTLLMTMYSLYNHKDGTDNTSMNIKFKVHYINAWVLHYKVWNFSRARYGFDMNDEEVCIKVRV